MIGRRWLLTRTRASSAKAGLVETSLFGESLRRDTALLGIYSGDRALSQRRVWGGEIARGFRVEFFFGYVAICDEVTGDAAEPFFVYRYLK